MSEVSSSNSEMTEEEQLFGSLKYVAESFSFVPFGDMILIGADRTFLISVPIAEVGEWVRKAYVKAEERHFNILAEEEENMKIAELGGFEL